MSSSDGGASAAKVSQMIREAFAVLSQGVELTVYNTRLGLKGQQVAKNIVWIDSDILRICADTSRPSIVDRALGKVAVGLYMRDISEVREGDDALDFKTSPMPPLDRDKCLSLLGTERALCFEMPSKFARDWFLERFRYVIADVLGEEERRSRLYTQLPSLQLAVLSPTEIEYVDHLRGLLLRGMHVLHHQSSGTVVKAVLSFDDKERCLVLSPASTGSFLSGLGFAQKTRLSTPVLDVSEVRSGCHSMGFVRTSSTDKSLECLSIVSSAQSMDLQMPSSSARDLLVDKLRLFCRKYKADAQSLVLSLPGSGSRGDRGGRGASSSSSSSSSSSGHKRSSAGQGQGEGGAGKSHYRPSGWGVSEEVREEASRLPSPPQAQAQRQKSAAVRPPAPPR